MQNNYFSMNRFQRATSDSMSNNNMSSNGISSGGMQSNETPSDGRTDTPMTTPSFPEMPMYNPENDINGNSRGTDIGPFPLPTPSLPSDGTSGGTDIGPLPLPTPSLPSGGASGGTDIGPLPLPTPSLPSGGTSGGTDIGPLPLPTPSLPSGGTSGSPDIPMTLPSFPDTPVASPIPPLYPSLPIERYTNVRFLHADESIGAVNVILNGTTLTEGLTYGNITAYTTEAAGNILITVLSTDNPAKYIVQETLRFNYGDTYTIALVPFSADNSANPATGFNSTLFRIEDTSCNKSLYNSCIRAINLSTYENPLSVALLDGRVIAQNLSFKDIGNFRQFTPGKYRVLVYENSCSHNSQIQPRAQVLGSAVIGVIPIIIGNANASCMADLFAASQITVGSSSIYTYYILGNPYTSGGIRVLFVESYFDA